MSNSLHRSCVETRNFDFVRHISFFTSISQSFSYVHYLPIPFLPKLLLPTNRYAYRSRGADDYLKIAENVAEGCEWRRLTDCESHEFAMQRPKRVSLLVLSLVLEISHYTDQFERRWRKNITCDHFSSEYVMLLIYITVICTDLTR